MAKFKLSPLAKADLLEIGVYTLENHGAAQKQKYLTKLDARFQWLTQWLTDNPLLGSSKDKIKAGYRSWKEREHLIFYRITDNNTIEIIGIPYQGMDIEQHLNTETIPK